MKSQVSQPLKSLEDICAISEWLEDNAGSKYRLAFTLGTNLGLRANELLSLRIRDVLNEDGTVKYYDAVELHGYMGGEARKVFLNKTCADALEWYFFGLPEKPNMDGFLFPSCLGGPLDVGAFRNILKRAAISCNIKENITTHTMRKTWALWRYKNGVSLYELAILCGHSSPMVTAQYIGVNTVEFLTLLDKTGILN